MYSQPMHLSHEFILCIQITREILNFNGESAVNGPCWPQVWNLPPSDVKWYFNALATQRFSSQAQLPKLSEVVGLSPYEATNCPTLEREQRWLYEKKEISTFWQSY